LSPVLTYKGDQAHVHERHAYMSALGCRHVCSRPSSSRAIQGPTVN